MCLLVCVAVLVVSGCLVFLYGWFGKVSMLVRFGEGKVGSGVCCLKKYGGLRVFDRKESCLGCIWRGEAAAGRVLVRGQ